MTAYFDALRRYFDFSGRSTRSQFWLFTLVYFVILIVAMVLDAGLMIDPTGEALVITGLVSLAHFIPSLSVMVRRLHDIGRSGWWILIGIIPVVGLIVLIIFACTPSQAGTSGLVGHNGYGRREPGMAPQPGAGAAMPASTLDQLEKLSALKASGAITEEEFGRMKADLMQRGLR
jgi:uncharacterized membrane protein YhaH (DUF805 family)